MLDKPRMSYPKVEAYSTIMQAWQSKCGCSYAASIAQAQTSSHHREDT